MSLGPLSYVSIIYAFMQEDSIHEILPQLFVEKKKAVPP